MSLFPKLPLEHAPADEPPVLIQLREPEPPVEVTVPLPVPVKAIETVLLSVNVFWGLRLCADGG